MLLSAYAKVRTTNYTGPVVLDCGDTDVFVQAAYVVQIRGDLLIKHKNAFINCRAMLSEEVADIIIPLTHLRLLWAWKEGVGEGMVVPEARELLG